MEQDFLILKKSVGILKIFSYILAGIGIAGAIIILLGKTPGSGKLASLGVLFMGILYFAIVYLVAEVINLLLEINERLKKLSQTVQQPSKREIR